MTIRIARLDGRDCAVWLGPALEIYVTAMNYPRGTEMHRAGLWREHIRRPGWEAYGAIATVSPAEDGSLDLVRRRLDPPLSPRGDEVLVGIAYGYRGARDQWWNQQLRAGLRSTGRDPRIIDEITEDYFELTELHVHPSAQGHRIGEWLLHRLLADRPEHHVLLSTPEIADEGNRAWALYRRMGFGDVLRGFTFTGDPRPFAFLGRRLPLVAPTVVPGTADPIVPGEPIVPGQPVPGESDRTR
ncbi:GNAT family N-acetyltransferase [Gordonia sp. L191]|uniref:GNAT family N-acetyltransferase n=1 Tax=Gordonia sp. L191 TaxID=2982699 RepID=UPI0024BFAB03|nr:GNAT family N-acetyltransferase [Gordonia sp. L191]WHU49026.1 GNAT family N-acetyltransferase [Gordonia sp. L191]